MSEHCNWFEEEGIGHESDCGHAFVFNDGGPTENGFKFCPYCGLPLVENRSEDDEDE